ncbi:DUF7828 domain-containing protein [Klebsiella oxytoca]|uniref:DUF7828 domain-containing protein n=1 Tax=Klebsiella oxytoca TaxID=571 RepID=UPI002247FEE8|nr:putative zinc ribbon protein [Klebsiella oxytoca]MCW9482079.1 putative zinc ribbon protein [Klebsiella oxytoca]HBR1412290.1 hypothetical protein [Klebsiella pneumoniae]HBR1476272.1 hypothetical protein [Klebsiella pneumoniae]
MRILKCYLANNSNGRFVTAKEVSASIDTWTCASCGGTLILSSAMQPVDINTARKNLSINLSITVSLQK